MSTAYREALIAGARSLSIDVSPSLADAMTAHYALVVKWAARINLTTVIDPVEAASIHGVDSLLFLEHLIEGTCLDIGSGAGFPGLVIALARPDLKITLLEPKRKRASFLRVALAELSRADVAVVEGRFEDAGAFDQLISRATIPPLDLIRGSAAKLSPGGRLILTSGAGAPTPEAVAAAAGEVGLHPLRRTQRVLPTGETRILDVIERSA